MQVNNPPGITSQELLMLAQNTASVIHHLYLHWTAGRYHQFFDDYHLNIDADGQVYKTCFALDELKPHTYKRNSGAVGIALCCALDANWRGNKPNFGTMPPTAKQLRSMAWVIAILCAGLGLLINSETVMTHGEAAYRDGYGPGSSDPDTRWDLFWLLDEQGNFLQGGVYLRELAQQYRAKLASADRSSVPPNSHQAPALQVPLFWE